ncbi:MAG TPA: type II and III secretion system protein family protein [Polyangia bacterium]|nr:type II and III secretion system protein family protein [Polyangia bacterium]
MKRSRAGLTTVAVFLLIPLSGRARAESGVSSVPAIKIEREVGAIKNLALETGQNRLLVLSEPIGRVSVADPRIADLKVITPMQLLLTSRGVGTTDLTLWNKRDEPLVLSLQVTRNLERLKSQLAELFPDERISVSAAGDLVVLTGEVSDVRVPERAAEVAQLHAEKVANLIKVVGNQQVQLEVKFAEVSRSGLRELGINFFHQDVGGRFLGGITNPGQLPDSFASVPGAATGSGQPPVPSPATGGFSLFFSGLPTFPFSAILNILEQSGLAKMLAEPTLVALSGQEAKFLVGGEFPIPMSSSLGAISVLWKKFGIILSFTPTVIADGALHLKLSAEVSDVDPSRSVTIGGISIPGLTSRQSETTVRLADGQSFAIAGLLSDKIQSTVSKIPLLGDLPILGALFRSVNYQRNETELLVVVTAHLAKPVAPHDAPHLPTDNELNDPNDVQLFLFGSVGGGHPDDPGSTMNRAAAAADAPAVRTALKDRGPSGELGFIR